MSKNKGIYQRSSRDWSQAALVDHWRAREEIEEVVHLEVERIEQFGQTLTMTWEMVWDCIERTSV